MLLATYFGCGLTPAAAKSKWEDVNPADLAATSSTTSPGADFEILFYRQTLDSYRDDTLSRYHVQAKVYTQAALERLTVFSFVYPREKEARSVMARVVKPDGSFVELAKSDFREISEFRKRGVEWKRLSFAFPNVQPGDVIEYKWTQPLQTGGFASYYQIFCQQPDVPVREFTFDVEQTAADYQVMWFNCQAERKDEKSRRIVIRNLPAYIEEPLMPPDSEFRSWILIVFSHPYLRFFKGDSVWEELGDYLATDFRAMTAPSKPARVKAAELTAGVSDPLEKIARLYDFVQSDIRNLDWDPAPELAAAKKKRDNADHAQSVSETLDRGSGNEADLNHLFAALARAAGFETRIAMSADRDEILNVKTEKGWIMTDRRTVMVKVGNAWKPFTPAIRFVPAGMLNTSDAGAMMYVCDEKKGWWYTAPVSSPELTQARRTAQFTLDDEGTLEGTVQVELSGHLAMDAREFARDRSLDDLGRGLRDQIAQRLPNVELTDVTYENLTDSQRPYRLRYSVRVPAFAEVLGSRLAFPLNYFEAGSPEELVNDTRRYPIFFDYAKTEHDEIQVVLPEGYTLDGGSSPAPVAKPGDVINAQYDLKYLPKTRTLSYNRDYVLGAGGAISFQAQSYPAIRRILSAIHRSDLHQLVIKPRAKPQTAAPATPATDSSTAP